MIQEPSIDLGARRAGFLGGAVVGAAVAAGGPAPEGRRRAPVALGDGLLEELVSGGVDLRRLAGRWVSWLTGDGLDADPALTDSLAHLRDFDAPALSLSAFSAAPIAAALPAALTAVSPRTMLSGTFHTARLLDPSAATGIAAVAVVVAASRYLSGANDMIPDVLQAIRINDAPQAFYDGIAAIARDPRRVPSVPASPLTPADQVAIWALHRVEHERNVTAAFAPLIAQPGNITAGAILGALIGARDGLDGWPEQWLEWGGEDLRLRLALAERLG